MSTRRRFIQHLGAVSALTAASFPAINAAASPGSRIVKVTRRDDTIVRAGGMGDNWHMSWAADDRQFVSLCDGLGFSDDPPGVFNASLFAISGGPQKPTFEHVDGYPDLMTSYTSGDHQRYYPFGTLAVDGRIFQFLSTPNYAFTPPESGPSPRFVGAKLIYSPDNGRTWHNQDGSTPVVWPARKDRSRANMLFFEEQQDAFALFSVLQMGRNYGQNRDGYVYVYAPNGSVDGAMNELVMARVPKAKIPERAAYEFFAGMSASGAATWSKDMSARKVVCTFPRGWVNAKLHPWAWMPSVVYNTPLGLYMMTNWGNAPAADGTWFDKPSYFGMWTAPNPWGPWTQIHEDKAWTPGGDANSRAFAAQIAPKWIAPDGKSFWLVWSDYQGDIPREVISEANKIDDPRQQTLAFHQISRKYKPFYAFNIQRVDLGIA